MLLTLYSSPGACSMAPHIALEETGEPFRLQPVLLSKKEQNTEAFRQINPMGRVPVLQTNGHLLTENVAILTYITRLFPQANLMPADPAEQASCISLMAFFASSVHVSYAQIVRPQRFCADEGSWEAVKETGRAAFFEHLRKIDSLLSKRDFLFSTYSVSDPYALVFYRWGLKAKLPMEELPFYTAHKDRLLKRPAVARVLAREQITFD